MQSGRRNPCAPLENTLDFFVKKGRLILAVDVTTQEQAEEIIGWMYAPEKPMKSELIDISWDKQTVTKQEGKLLDAIKECYDLLPTYEE